MNIIFSANNYTEYLKGRIQALPKQGHGVRSQWAKAIDCQVAFVSHVLNDRYHLNLEQACALSQHLGHNELEHEYFLNLVSKARAGTKNLKNFFESRLSQIRLQVEKSNSQIQNRMKIQNELSIEDQAIYYSSWIFSAVHIILTIPEFQTSAEVIAQHFNEQISSIRKVLEFLESRGLIEQKQGRMQVKNFYMFINRKSPLFSSQQVTWRQKAIQSIYQNKENHVHFSSVFSISKEDEEKIRKLLLQTIENSTEIIKPSKEEKLFSIGIDFFEVR